MHIAQCGSASMEYLHKKICNHISMVLRWTHNLLELTLNTFLFRKWNVYAINTLQLFIACCLCIVISPFLLWFLRTNVVYTTPAFINHLNCHNLWATELLKMHISSRTICVQLKRTTLFYTHIRLFLCYWCWDAYYVKTIINSSEH